MARFAWIAFFGVLSAAALTGCKQRCFMTKEDFLHYQSEALANIVNPPTVTDHLPVFDVAAVSTVLSPEGKKRMMSLAECIALGLENGRNNGSGTIAPSPVSAGTGGFPDPSALSDSIRVYSYDPARLYTEIEASLSRFDAQWNTSMTWGKQDRPVGSALDQFQAGLLDSIQRDTAALRSDLVKPLPTGGLAGITFRTDYEFSNLNQRVNPAYRPQLEFAFEQPLLQGAGVAINQLRSSHPGSNLFNISQPVAAQGILLARLTYNGGQVEFERRLQDQLLAIEQAYWDLYYAYWNLYSRETAMRQSHYAWMIARARKQAGRIRDQNFYEIEEQYQFFRTQRLQALGGTTGNPGVLEAERQLRYKIGLPADDGTRLIPIDAPTTAPYKPDWAGSLAEAFARRPELSGTRLGLQHAQLQLLALRDNLLPDLRVFGRYNVNDLGNHLDGEDDNAALRNLARNRFNDWEIGATLNIPIGFRGQHAVVREAELQVAKWTLFLRQQESATAYQLQDTYRRLFQYSEEVGMQRARRVAAAKQLELLYQKFIVGVGNIDTDDTVTQMLDAQRNWADALRDEYRAITLYNIALAEFERNKGTLLQHNNVNVVEGPLPACAQARASQHIRERTQGCVLNHGCAPVAEPTVEELTTDQKWLERAMPKLPNERAATLPEVLRDQQNQPRLPDGLITPTTGNRPITAPLEKPKVEAPRTGPTLLPPDVPLPPRP
jgi:hypothetical protein